MQPAQKYLSGLGLLVALSQPCQADIYAFIDSNGVRHISNVPNDPRYRLVMRTPTYGRSAPRRRSSPGEATSSAARKPFGINEDNRRRYGPTIETIAREQRLDSALIHAVISAESAFEPAAVSRAGAMGLMQLMPGTAATYGVEDPFDPIANIQGGARYLRKLMDQFQHLSLVLAAYNAGENAVIRYGNAIPPYDETRTYVSRVLSFYRHYRGTP